MVNPKGKTRMETRMKTTRSRMTKDYDSRHIDLSHGFMAINDLHHNGAYSPTLHIDLYDMRHHDRIVLSMAKEYKNKVHIHYF